MAATTTAVVQSGGQSVQRYARPGLTSTHPKGTPVAANAASPAVPSPGRFQHPRLAEIVKRRSANDFGYTNVTAVLANAGVLLATFIASAGIHQVLNFGISSIGLDKVPSPVEASWVVAVVRFILCCNIYYALRPVLPYVSKPDTIDDIPLTPSQRALLGLPRSASDTPGPDNYITPPRYRRSSPSTFVGSAQSDATNMASYSASPLSTSRYTLGFSPTPQQATGTPSRRLSGSPFSPSSPLFNKAFTNSPSRNNDVLPNADWTESTRSLLAGNTSVSSFQSSLRRSQSAREGGKFQQEPGTPSPSAREKSRVNVQPGLNYKWLYEKNYKVSKTGGIEYD